MACDYTLIGEELFAASAYLSGEPRLVGGLKGADMLKLVIIAVIVVGCVLETFGIHGFTAVDADPVGGAHETRDPAVADRR